MLRGGNQGDAVNQKLFRQPGVAGGGDALAGVTVGQGQGSAVPPMAKPR